VLPPDPDSFAENMALVGPGLVTGASDDDPSGIARYSQGGAQFGFGTLWLALYSYPLMCAIQEISARIGRVTGVGIAANIRKMYPRPVVYGIVSMLLVSSIFNLGADLGAMGESAHMLFGGPAWVHLLLMGLISILLQIFVPYTRYVKYLKFLVLSLMAYEVTAFLVHIDWPAALRAIHRAAGKNISWRLLDNDCGDIRNNHQPVSFFLASFAGSGGSKGSARRTSTQTGSCAGTKTTAQN